MELRGVYHDAFWLCALAKEISYWWTGLVCGIEDEIFPLGLVRMQYMISQDLFELSWVEYGYLYAVPNLLFSHNGAGQWLTHAGKAESSAGAWRCSATVCGLVVKEVDCSRLQGRTPRSSAGHLCLLNVRHVKLVVVLNNTLWDVTTRLLSSIVTACKGIH